MQFFLEGSLKGLSKWLRFLGYKTVVCEHRITKEEIIKHKNKFFLVTSKETANILEKTGINYLLLPNENIKTQLFLVINKLNLNLELKLNICTVCGEELIPIKKEDFKDKIPPRVYERFDEYNFCPKCKRIYWEGDHIQRLKQKFSAMMSLISQSKFSK